MEAVLAASLLRRKIIEDENGLRLVKLRDARCAIFKITEDGLWRDIG